MSPSRRPVLARRVAAVVVAAGLLLVAACGSDDDPAPAASAAPVTTSATPLSAEQLAVVVRAQTKELNKAARAFDRCERSGIAGYGFNTCWRKSLPTTVVAAGFAETLRSAGAPAQYAAVQRRLDQLAKDRARIRKGCRTGDDQTCDNALMRYRDDLQKVQWELDLV